MKFDNATWIREMTTWLGNLEWKYPTGNSSLQSKLRHLSFVRQEWLDINIELQQYITMHFKSDFQLLMTIPGIGPIIAIGILAELGDMKRVPEV